MKEWLMEAVIAKLEDEIDAEEGLASLAEAEGTKFSNIFDEQVVSTPLVHILSLTTIGIPVRGLKSPLAISSSAF